MAADGRRQEQGKMWFRGQILILPAAIGGHLRLNCS
jgi:hypothetical protein